MTAGKRVPSNFGPSAATLIGAPAKWTILKQQQPGIMTSAIQAPRGLVLNVGHEAGAKADNFMGYTFPIGCKERGSDTERDLFLKKNAWGHMYR